jgi:hypothetical protein
MARLPNWTEDEFRTLLDNPETSPADLSQGPLARSPEAIALIRQAAREFEAGHDNDRLSQTMRDVLTERTA